MLIEITLGDPGDFLDAGDALDRSAIAALAERDEALFQRDVTDLRGAGAFNTELANGIGRAKQLVNADSAREPGLATIAAAGGFVECLWQRSGEICRDIVVGWVVRDFAFRAQSAYQPLSQHAFDGARA